MQPRITNRSLLTFLLFFKILVTGPLVFAESQDGDYKGITDPFGDPSSYEFAQDEAEDKEFFHLGRFMMLGLDGGAGIFTGGLGTTTDPAGYYGLRLLYFFDRSIAIEFAGHFARHLDSITSNGTTLLNVETDLIPLTAGLRFYFDTRSSPKALSIANPYLAFGPGGYIRSQTVVGGTSASATSEPAQTTSFGAYAGAGIEFLIYRKHIYLGLDARYHYILFPDEGSTNFVPGASGVDRSGDYISLALSLSYNY